MKLKHIFYWLNTISCCFFITSVQGQVQNYSIVGNLTPITPNAWQFNKYTDLPVSEYTGLPNISVPLYEIKVDGVTIPLSLGYHAGGIKVNEEASWVGLGWDMTVGSIVQQIADQDDYAAAKHLQPDYYNSGTPNLFPLKYAWARPITGASDLECTYGCNVNLGTPITPLAADGIEIYTGNYAPFNGDYGYQTGQNYLNFFSSHDVNFGFSIDSEPDVFTANFLGHSFKFIRDPQTGQVVVMNKKGYKVTRTRQIWTVLVPGGEEYDFELKDVVNTVNNSTSITGTQSSSNSLPSSNIWFLTKIITKNKKVITFNYTQTPTQSVYPTVTERGSDATLQFSNYTGNSADWGTFAQSADLTTATPGLAICPSVSYSSEKYTYLNSIVFPQGTVNFSLSARNDLQGGLKLDSMAVSSNQLIKSYKFNYSYFDASSVAGNTYSFPTTVGSWGNCPLYRLELLSLKDNLGGTYSFSYNNTQLPAKNSFAVDFWGYYNGATGNTTFIPDAARFNKTGWRTNSDNHSANAGYTTACILQGIQYPTGGTANFTFELNQFGNYWVPDYANNSNTTSSGDGLRIKSITWNESNGTQLKKTNYTYSGGIASIPLNFFRTYGYNTCEPQTLVPGGAYTLSRLYTVYETNMNGLYTGNPFASFNGVGYSQVVKSDVDNAGMTNGKTVSNYYNRPDLVYNSITVAQQSAPTLPSYKDQAADAENGSLQSQLYYDNNNNRLKQVTNTYTKVNSPIYYGARLMGYASFVRYIFDYASHTYTQRTLPQNMVGYYPIFDFETLLTSSTETDYFGTDSVMLSTSNTYDTFNQIASTSKSNSSLAETTYFHYPYNVTATTVLDTLIARNRLTDIVQVVHAGASPYNLSRYYAQTGTLVAPSQDVVVIRSTGMSTPSTTTMYDQYDTSNGNLLQYTKNTLSCSFIYDYNKEYVIAEVKNAPYTSIAYTSFEADGKGRWKYTGNNLPDNTAPTGKKDYSLANGNIYRDSLNTSLTYVVSYWSKSGPQSVNGSTTPLQGYTYNGWTYYENQVANPSAGTITISGTGTIDELRLYPSNAQMTSFTYEPLVGITSLSDPAGKISYYEYDGSKRLLDIRDQSRNILKAYCYNYAGQSTACGVNISFSSFAKSGAFTRSCGTGYAGSLVTYTVPAGRYTSTMSQADADNQAQADLSANGQSYANSNGSCAEQTIYARIEITNQHTTYTDFDVNNSNTTADLYVRFYANSSCTIPLNIGSAITVNVTASYDTEYGYGGSSTGSYNQTVSAALGDSQEYLGNITLSTINSYNDPSYGYITDTYTYGFSVASNGSLYIPLTNYYY